MDMEQIPGGLFRPGFSTEEKFKEGYKSSAFYVEGDYKNEYRKHLVALGHIANMAKSYILENWRSVTDWSGLDMRITHGPTGEVTEYYNHEKAIQRREKALARKKDLEESGLTKVRTCGAFDSLMEKSLELKKEKHNPILEFTDVVLDPTDGDFSVTINGDKKHWWIRNEEVIVIADYIETQLKEKDAKVG
jgi:hypothetical protein